MNPLSQEHRVRIPNNSKTLVKGKKAKYRTHKDKATAGLQVWSQGHVAKEKNKKKKGKSKKPNSKSKDPLLNIERCNQEVKVKIQKARNHWSKSREAKVRRYQINHKPNGSMRKEYKRYVLIYPNFPCI
jgi:hypothetical protein